MLAGVLLSTVLIHHLNDYRGHTEANSRGADLIFVHNLWISVWALNIIVSYLVSQFLLITEEDTWLYYQLYKFI